jgi:hypothetical protein
MVPPSEDTTEQNFVQRDGSRHASEPASGAECRPASFEKPPSESEIDMKKSPGTVSAAGTQSMDLLI